MISLRFCLFFLLGEFKKHFKAEHFVVEETRVEEALELPSTVSKALREKIELLVKDCDMLWTDNDIGVCEFTIKDLTEKPGEVIQEWHDLTCGPDEDVQGSILISLQYIPFGDHQDDSRKTLDSYFPDRSNNKVSLYQCADTPHLPVFQVENNYFKIFHLIAHI